MAQHVVGIEREEAIDVRIDVADEFVLDALAYHGALLARDGEHVGFGLGQDRLAEGDVQLLPRPVRMAGLEVAIFQVLHAKLTGQAVGLGLEQGKRLLAGIGGGGDAAIHAERQ